MVEEPEAVAPEPAPVRVLKPAPSSAHACASTSSRSGARRRSSRGAALAAETSNDIDTSNKTERLSFAEAQTLSSSPQSTGSRRSNRSLVQPLHHTDSSP